MPSRRRGPGQPRLDRRICRKGEARHRRRKLEESATRLATQRRLDRRVCGRVAAARMQYRSAHRRLDRCVCE